MLKDKVLIGAAFILTGMIIGTTGGLLALKNLQESDYPSIEYIYEDGAGRLSNGQTFCIKGELCDD